jgi:hypothetical protein
MRHAAQLEGRPAAELLAQLPPLPPRVTEVTFLAAMRQVVGLMFNWPGLMRERAPAGQDFLLQLLGGLGELPPSLLHLWVVTGDVEWHVTAAMQAKERGNTAYAAGDTHAALIAYRTGIDSLRPFTPAYLERCEHAMILDEQFHGEEPLDGPALAMDMA